jgi:hypothetical protein
MGEAGDWLVSSWRDRIVTCKIWYCHNEEFGTCWRVSAMVLSVETMVPYAEERGTCWRFGSMILKNLEHGIQESVPSYWRVYIEAWSTEIMVPCVKILDFETAVFVLQPWRVWTMIWKVFGLSIEELPPWCCIVSTMVLKRQDFVLKLWDYALKNKDLLLKGNSYGTEGREV